MSIKIASMNFGDCDTILHNTPNGMKNIAEVLGPNGEVYWSAIKELAGIPPLSIRSNGTMLLDYLISGNMVQTGTPTPTTPIQPQECGERTGNLWNEMYPNISGTLRYVPLYVGQGSFTLSTTIPNYQSIANVFLMPGNVSTGASSLVYGAWYGKSVTMTSVDGYVTIVYRFYNGTESPENHQTMLNSGSTALPYEPYGYKIPISSGGENLWDGDVPQYVYAKDYKKYNPDNAIVLKAGTYTVSSDGRSPTIQVFDDSYTQLSVSDVITFSSSYYVVWDGFAISPTVNTVRSVTITLLSDCVLTFTVTDNLGTYIMLNRGSTALPYSPYNRTTTPIYLGEVPTTRRIKKLVLTGEENWNTSQNNYYITVRGYYSLYDVGRHLSICSHFPIKQELTLPEMHYGLGGLVDGNANTKWNGNIVFNPSPMISSLTAWKSYLSDQYAAGTPVTVWYVLVEPETGIVNEPLRKIGDYADTISYEQAGVQIPTLHGNTVIDVDTELNPSQMYIKYK